MNTLKAPQNCTKKRIAHERKPAGGVTSPLGVIHPSPSLYCSKAASTKSNLKPPGSELSRDLEEYRVDYSRLHGLK